MPATSAPATINEYVAGFPPGVREKLEAVRRTVHEAAPDAEETIKYGMPSFVLSGILVHFGAFKTHLGFYSVPSELAPELAAYKQGRGSVRFPFDRPLQLELISRIVQVRAEQNLARAKTKGRRPR